MESLQCYESEHRSEAQTRKQIDDVPPEFLAERDRQHRYDTVSERIHAETDGCLEIGTIKIPRHGREPHVVRPSSSSCNHQQSKWNPLEMRGRQAVPVVTVNIHATRVINHFLALDQFTGFLVSPASNST